MYDMTDAVKSRVRSSLVNPLGAKYSLAEQMLCLFDMFAWVTCLKNLHDVHFSLFPAKTNDSVLK